MSKNYLRMYEDGKMDDFMEEEATSAIAGKRAPKVRNGQRDEKRLRDTYISANKKGAASRAARLAKNAAESEKPQGRFEKSAISDLQDELCGKKRGGYKRH